MEAIEQLRERLARVADLNAAQAVLGWDQETYMPPGAGAARAQQLATLGRLSHEMLTDSDQKIARPRQVYLGAQRRSYLPMADRHPVELVNG